MAERLGEKLHNDDPSQYKEKVWQRINEFNGKPIPIGDLLDRPEKACVVFQNSKERVTCEGWCSRMCINENIPDRVFNHF